jgi:hypothetical protein
MLFSILSVLMSRVMAELFFYIIVILFRVMANPFVPL